MYLLVSSAPWFGVQYLAWLVPWVVAFGAGATATYYVAGTVLLSAYYSAAAGQFLWYLANSLERPPWTGTVMCLGRLCWVVVCYITFVSARRLLARRADSSEEEE